MGRSALAESLVLTALTRCRSRRAGKFADRNPSNTECGGKLTACRRIRIFVVFARSFVSRRAARRRLLLALTHFFNIRPEIRRIEVDIERISMPSVAAFKSRLEGVI